MNKEKILLRLADIRNELYLLDNGRDSYSQQELVILQEMINSLKNEQSRLEEYLEYSL